MNDLATSQPAADERPRVIVEVQGGNVQAIFADRPLNVDVLDHDNWNGIDQALHPEEWKRFAAMPKEIDASRLLEQVY